MVRWGRGRQGVVEVARLMSEHRSCTVSYLPHEERPSADAKDAPAKNQALACERHRHRLVCNVDDEVGIAIEGKGRIRGRGCSQAMHVAIDLPRFG